MSKELCYLKRVQPVAYHGFHAPGARSRFRVPFSDIFHGFTHPYATSFYLYYLLTFCVNRPTHSCTQTFNFSLARMCLFVGPIFLIPGQFQHPLKWRPGHVSPPPCPPLGTPLVETTKYVISGLFKKSRNVRFHFFK